MWLSETKNGELATYVIVVRRPPQVLLPTLTLISSSFGYWSSVNKTKFIVPLLIRFSMSFSLVGETARCRSTHQQDSSYKEDFEAAAEHRQSNYACDKGPSTCEPSSSNTCKQTRSSRYISLMAHTQRIGPNRNVRRRSIVNRLGVPIANNSIHLILRYLNQVPHKATGLKQHRYAVSSLMDMAYWSSE
ncbi:hypothetical protein Tco_0394779 [Tanacetum coccineum]